MKSGFFRMRKEFVGKKETKSNFLSLSLLNDAKIGKFHSVFKTTFNVKLGNQLIHFGREGMPLSAFGCLLKKTDMDAILEEGIPGDLVRYRNGKLTFYTRHHILTVPFGNFEDVDLTIPFQPIDRSQIRESLLFQHLQKIEFWSQIGLPPDPILKNHVFALESASQLSNEELEEILPYFVGRGNGLTPGGDDFLVGITMARKAFEKTEQWDAAVRAALQKRNTTDISLAYYNATFSGYVSELFCVLVRSLSWKSESDIEDMIGLVRQYGHTSGTDTLFGFFTGLKLLINEKRDL